jgi:PAS domain S-box-containing protein
MGDVRFEHPYRRLAEGTNRVAAIRALSDEEVIMALAASRDAKDSYLANVLASEAMNRVRRKSTILDTAAEAVLAHDVEGKATYANPAAERMYGWTSQEMLGKALHDMTHHTRDDGTRFPASECPIARILQTGETILGYETIQWRKDGSSFPGLINAAPIRRDDEIVGFVTTITDVTERKRAEEERTYLAAIVQDSDDAIFGLSLGGAVTSWNSGAQRLYGYSPEEIVGKSVEILVPPGLPNDVPGIMDRLRRGERVHHYETKRMAKDGRVLDVSLTISPLRDAKGNLIGASKIARDITAQKRAQEERDEAARRSSFMARASRLLASSLDYRKTLQRVAQLAVPSFADWCGLSLLEEGRLVTVAVAHEDPQKVELARQLEQQYPEPRDSAAYQVLRTGEPLLVKEIPDALLRETAQSPKHYRILRELGMRSAIVAPLSAGGETLGVLAFLSAESGQEYDEDDLAFAMDLAGRAGSAVESARLHRALQESEARYRALFEDNPSIFLILDAHRRILRANTFGARYLGYEPEELAGVDGLNLYHPEDRDAARQTHAQVMADTQGRPVGLEARKLRKDGSILWVHETSLPIEWTGGGRQVLVSCTDITPRVEAEERARWLASIVENSRDAILHETKEGEILDWNDGAARMFGYAREEVLGKNVAMLVPLERRGELGTINARVARGEILPPVETRRRRKDGSLVDVSLLISPVRDEGGRIASLSATYRDIGALRAAYDALVAAEARYHGLFESFPEALVTLDGKANVVDANAKAEELSGYAADELRGSSLAPLIHPDDFPRVLEEHARVLEGRTSRIVYRAKHKDGRWMRLRVTSVPIRAEERIVGAHARIVDLDRPEESRRAGDPS